jgi:hypothetical protein
MENKLRIPESFTELDRFLIEKTEEAIKDGIELERWSRDPGRKVQEIPLNLNRNYSLENRVYGYLTETSINGKTRSVIGARQEVEFGRISSPNPEAALQDYVLGEFMPTARWTYPDGYPGGFTFDQMIYCTQEGEVGRYPADQKDSVQDWRLIGKRYRWSLLTVFLHDFVMKMGPMTKRFQEAVAVVQHPEFIHINRNPTPEFKLEVAIGYPFIDYAPVPNYFGFGPGKFDWAVKLFAFCLRHNNEVRCNMDFVAGARPKKVFDFGKGIPDPIYGSSAVLGKISLGLFDNRKFHEWMDLQMAAQHSRVHQALMEGTARKFADWQKRQ